MLDYFPTEDSYRVHFENLRWQGTPTCPHCACEKSYKINIKGEFNGLYKCGDCRKRYTVRVGTILEGSHLPIKTWYMAIYLMSSHKHGDSTRELVNDLGITQKTAWFMQKRIHHGLGQSVEDEDQSDDLASMDETFVGGKNRNRHADKKVVKSQGRSYKDKTPVFGLIQNGKVFTKVIPDTSRETLTPIVESLVTKGATIVTDEWGGYNRLNWSYDRQIVNHRTKEYQNEGGYSTNNVENFWSHLKRGITGTYYKVSRHHLQKYCDEFSFRFNNRSSHVSVRFLTALKTTEKGRLRYKDLIIPKPVLPPMAFPELGF